MSHWNAVRIKAATTRRQLLEERGRNPDDLISPQELIDLASRHFDILISPASKDSDTLLGSVAVLSNDMIFFDQSLQEGYRQYCIAHEFGHYILHRRTDKCTDSDIRDFSSEGEAPTPVQEVEGYGSRERRERDANLFALEFLLPLDVARRTFLSNDDSFGRIVEVTGLPASLIYSQLATALLIPTSAVKEDKPQAEVNLDESQSAAAKADSGPLLLTAGPGTGKTQTLVQRILFLINEKGIDPERILALTFSNKAAQEMRERIAVTAPEPASRMSVMTFHSYALELLRKYWKEAGLKPDSEIIERLDAILHLEQNLDELDLRHFQVIENPAAEIPTILNSISRAKDELVSPEEFLEQVAREESQASTEDEKIRIEKLHEIGRVYAFYQNFLVRTKQLDFGELIFRAVRLIRSHPQIKRTLQRKYDAILVDEFQDINRASGVLVKEIAGDGKGLWAVGDLRQSIYRWRGASTANIKQFESDYPGTVRMSLGVNYRSGREVVDLFSEFAKGMLAIQDPNFSGWAISRERVAEIHHHVAHNLDGETSFIARAAVEKSKQGIPFKDQAVICRSNGQLNMIAERLVQSGVPVLFLGDIFERPEIRDLIAFLDVQSSDRGFGLVRLADSPEYRMSREDVACVMEAASSEDMDFRKFISGDGIPPMMSAEGATSLLALRSDMSDIPQDVSAYEALATFLFKNQKFIKRLMADSTGVLGAQRLLAVFQFLNLAKSMEQRFFKEGEENRQIERFLVHIRRLVTFREDKILSQMPESASELDAVRMLTVHKSKGLEFDTVYLPYLGKGIFPGKDSDEGCLVPKEIPSAESEYLEEEECLFFVAMSRARRSLHFSRSRRYNSRSTDAPSLFLEKLNDRLPEAVETVREETEKAIADEKLLEGFHKEEIPVYEMNRYEKCPRQFYYRNVLKLAGRKTESAYDKFKDIVRHTIRDIQTSLKKREQVTECLALAKLGFYWQLGEMDSEPYSKIYKKRAEEMILSVISRIGESRSEIITIFLTLGFEVGRVSAIPDHLEMRSVEEGLLIRSFQTGKEPGTEKALTVEDKEVVMLLAAREKFHGAPVTIVRTYLSTDSDREVRISDKVIANRTEKFKKNLEGIRSGAFPAKPNKVKCSNCPYYFICDKK